MSYGSFPYGSPPIGGLANLSGDWTPDLRIRLYYKNILETAAVTVTSENTSYPKYRLYDRNIGLLFKGNSAPSVFGIVIDLGTMFVYPDIDTIILGPQHNLAGLTVRLIYSDDGFNFYQAVAWVASSGINEKSFTLQNHRYWFFNIYDSASPPEIGELFLTKAYVFQTNPIMGAGEKWRRNIFSEELESGVDTEVKRGERKRVRIYDLRDVRQEQKIDLETWDALCEGVKPFWVQDHNGALLYMKTLSDLEFKYDGEDPAPYYSCHLELREVLGVTL